jgi:hypothetical protein
MTNFQIVAQAKKLKIPFFRGVFMRDLLPRHTLHNECAIVNLDSYKNQGSHWVAYIKRGNVVRYFDSFGDLKPPKELIHYFGPGAEIIYNYQRKQKKYSVNCGQLSLQFLKTQCSV